MASLTGVGAATGTFNDVAPSAGPTRIPVRATTGNAKRERDIASNLRGLLSDGSADQSNDCILEGRKKHGPSIADDNNIDEHQSERLFWRSIQLHFRQGISRPALRLMMLWLAPPAAFFHKLP